MSLLTMHPWSLMVPRSSWHQTWKFYAVSQHLATCFKEVQTWRIWTASVIVMNGWCSIKLCRHFEVWSLVYVFLFSCIFIDFPYWVYNISKGFSTQRSTPLWFYFWLSNLRERTLVRDFNFPNPDHSWGFWRDENTKWPSSWCPFNHFPVGWKVPEFHHDFTPRKLSDFGFARFLKRGVLCSENIGTPAFMAPEQQLLKSGSSTLDLKIFQRFLWFLRHIYITCQSRFPSLQLRFNI